MTDSQSNKGVLLNLRVIDQEAVDALATRLQALVDSATAAAASLQSAMERSQQAAREIPDASAQLEERLKLGLRVMKGLDATNQRAERISGDLVQHLEQASSVGEQIHSTATQEQARLTMAAQQATEFFDSKADAAISRAEKLLAIFEQAESNIALASLRAAVLAGKPPSTPRQSPEPPGAMRPTHAPTEADQPPVEAPEPRAEQAPRRGQIRMDRLTEGGAEKVVRLEQSPDLGLRDRLEATSARMQELEREREDAVRVLEGQRALLSGMYDELRANLDELAMAAAALRHGTLSDQQRQHVERASASVAALMDLISGISDPPGTTRRPQDLGDFELRQAIESVVGHLTKGAADRNVSLTCQIENDVPAVVSGDSARLRQVLLYIVSGAIKLIKRGELSLKTACEVTVDADVTIRITVSHSATDFDREPLETLKAAAAGEEAADAKSPRRGLGLVIARQLIDDLDGKFGVEIDDLSGFSIWFTTTWKKGSASGDARRSSNRLKLESVSSNLGEVVDLSLGGARVVSPKMLEGQVEIQVSDPETTVTLPAEVMWTNRIGRRKFEVGLRFVHVTADAAERLKRISIQNRVRRVLDET